MSLLTPIAKLAVIGAGVGIIGLVAATYCSGGAPALVEPGYVDPKMVELYTPKNEKGNLELYLSYADGDSKVALPIMAGPNGPAVGSADYQWNNMDADTKSGLVNGSWNELNVDTRKTILRNDLEKMLETYGGQSE